MGLYLVPGVDERYAFCSQTQGEIFQFAWFRIQDLMNQMKKGQQISVGSQAAKFVHVRAPWLQCPHHSALQVHNLVVAQLIHTAAGAWPDVWHIIFWFLIV